MKKTTLAAAAVGLQLLCASGADAAQIRLFGSQANVTFEGLTGAQTVQALFFQGAEFSCQVPRIVNQPLTGGFTDCFGARVDYEFSVDNPSDGLAALTSIGTASNSRNFPTVNPEAVEQLEITIDPLNPTLNLATRALTAAREESQTVSVTTGMDGLPYTLTTITPSITPFLTARFILIFDDSLTARELKDSTSDVPLPAALPLFVAGLSTLAAAKRRRRKKV